MRLKAVLFFACMPMLLWAQSSRVDTLRSLILDGGKSNYVMIFAHRGDWRNAPAENSLLAYQRCIDEGIDGIEIDLQMTRDGVLVVMHDETLDRTTTGKGKVCDYTLEELKNLYLLSPIGVVTRQRIPTFEEVLKLAKGYWGAKSKHFKMAKEAVMKSGNYAYIGRKQKKRDFRRLWITRISAGCKANGINYSTFMNGLKKAGITLNRKMLSEIAIADAAGFTALVEKAKAAL